MKVVTLARKPVKGSVATCASDYGTGSLNIDGARIGTTEKMSFSRAAPYHDAVGGQGRTWNPTSTPGIEREQHGAGRWPANLILQHLPLCECFGSEEVADWRCAEGCPVADLECQSGVLTSGARDGKHIPNWEGEKGPYWSGNDTGNTFAASKGTAARFFKQVKL